MLNAPYGLAFDGDGNLLVADHSNQRIRSIDVQGTINTIAEIGAMGYTGDGGAATAARLAYPVGIAVNKNGEIFIGDRDNHAVRKIDAYGNISTFAGNWTVPSSRPWRQLVAAGLLKEEKKIGGKEADRYAVGRAFS